MKGNSTRCEKCGKEHDGPCPPAPYFYTPGWGAVEARVYDQRRAVRESQKKVSEDAPKKAPF